MDECEIYTSKSEKLKADLQGAMNLIYDSITINNERKKPININWQIKIKNELYPKLNKYPTMRDEKALALTAKELNDIFSDFLELIAWISNTYEFVPSKQIFCAFACITVSAYNNLMKNGEEEVKETMDKIENYLFDSIFSGAEGGTQKETSSMVRAKAKVMGHEITEAQADIHITTENTGLSPAQFSRQLDGIMQNAIVGKK